MRVCMYVCMYIGLGGVIKGLPVLVYDVLGVRNMANGRHVEYSGKIAG